MPQKSDKQQQKIVQHLNGRQIICVLLGKGKTENEIWIFGSNF